MYTFLLVLLIIDSLVLVTAILLQSGKGDGRSASFGGVSSSSDSLLGTRQAGNLLTKTSWWGGGIFLFLAYVLSLMSTQQRAPSSVLDQAFTPAPVTAPAQAAPNANSTIPLTPAAPATGNAPAGGNAPATTPAPATKP
jgi:preprotein translocase subunit SecG